MINTHVTNTSMQYWYPRYTTKFILFVDHSRKLKTYHLFYINTCFYILLTYRLILKLRNLWFNCFYFESFFILSNICFINFIDKASIGDLKRHILENISYIANLSIVMNKQEMSHKEIITNFFEPLKIMHDSIKMFYS